MIDIISKRDGPRREDVAAKRLIDRNRPVIEGLANYLTGGNYAAMRRPPAAPQPDGLILHDLGAGQSADVEHRPYVRISLNDRVVLVDGNTNKQLQFLGEIRDGPDGRRFALATAANKFFSPLADDLCETLSPLDGRLVSEAFSEDHLASEICKLLGIE